MATEKPKDQQSPQPVQDGEAAPQPQGESQPPTAAASSAATSSGGGGGGGGQPTKCVYIFRNGDVFAPSKKFVLNRRHLRDWDVFLEQVTLSVNPLRGAVRAIVTPKRGRRHIQDLDSFDDKAHYVALAKGERFKPMTYVPEGDIHGADGGQNANGVASPVASPRRPVGSNRVVLEPILPVVHNKKLMSVQPRFGTKMDVISSQSKAIRVYRNGDEFTPAIITMLRPSEQVSMEVVLRAVEERVVLPNNMAIRKLYDLSGRRILDPKELQHEKHYIAGGHEPFMPRPYGQKLPVIVIGKAERMSSIKYLSQPMTPEKQSTRKSKAEQQSAAKNGGGAGSGGSGANGTSGGASKQKQAQQAVENPGTSDHKAKPTREEQEKSASAIQTSLRGFQARKEAAAKMAQKPIDIRNDPANSKAQRQKQQQKQQPRKQPMTEDEQAAAKSIQASVNSYKTRKTVAKQQAAKAPPA